MRMHIKKTYNSRLSATQNNGDELHVVPEDVDNNTANEVR